MVRETRILLGAPLLGLHIFACMASEDLVTTSEHEELELQSWSAHGTLEPACDVNPDPDIVEIYLEARQSWVQLTPGKYTEVWAYNGMVPGPLIQGDIGNTLIVHFTNHLPEPTTIHWHGVEVPAHMDGSNISQREVPPGGYFRYEFKLLRASTHWYHPHLRSSKQVEMGLQGPLVVRDPHDKKLKLPKPKHEQVFVLDDMLLDAEGQIAPFATDRDSDLTPLERAEKQLNGREGNVLLVNGRELPTIHVRPGVPQRWRFINTANARFMRVSVPGHTMYRIGGDGGLLEQAIPIASVDMTPDPHHPGQQISNPDPRRGLLLTPGERADVVITPVGTPGSELFVEWHDYARGRHSVTYQADGSIGLGHAHDDGRRPPVRLMRIRFVGKRKTSKKALPSSLPTIPRVDASAATAVLPIVFGHGQPDSRGDVVFFNAVKDQDGDGRPDPLPFERVTSADAHDVTVGQTVIVEAINMTGADHPFHLHGFFFQPQEIELIDMDSPDNNRVVPFAFVENKDTILLPGRPGAPGRSRTILRVAVKFDDAGREGQVAAFGKDPGSEHSGGWLAHCHLLEHAAQGMMTFLELRYPE